MNHAPIAGTGSERRRLRLNGSAQQKSGAPRMRWPQLPCAWMCPRRREAATANMAGARKAFAEGLATAKAGGLDVQAPTHSRFVSASRRTCARRNDQARSAMLSAMKQIVPTSSGFE